jgi:hypothetical protein
MRRWIRIPAHRVISARPCCSDEIKCVVGDRQAIPSPGMKRVGSPMRRTCAPTIRAQPVFLRSENDRVASQRLRPPTLGTRGAATVATPARHRRRGRDSENRGSERKSPAMTSFFPQDVPAFGLFFFPAFSSPARRSFFASSGSKGTSRFDPTTNAEAANLA